MAWILAGIGATVGIGYVPNEIDTAFKDNMVSYYFIITHFEFLFSYENKNE